MNLITKIGGEANSAPRLFLSPLSVCSPSKSTRLTHRISYFRSCQWLSAASYALSMRAVASGIE